MKKSRTLLLVVLSLFFALSLAGGTMAAAEQSPNPDAAASQYEAGGEVLKFTIPAADFFLQDGPASGGLWEDWWAADGGIAKISLASGNLWADGAAATYSPQDGDRIVYDVYSPNPVPGIGGVDFHYFGGTSSLNDVLSTVVDQNGYSAACGADLTDVLQAGWYHREFTIPDSVEGNINSILFTAQLKLPLPSADIQVFYKNVKILDKDGAVKFRIFADGIQAWRPDSAQYLFNAGAIKPGLNKEQFQNEFPQLLAEWTASASTSFEYDGWGQYVWGSSGYEPCNDLTSAQFFSFAADVGYCAGSDESLSAPSVTVSQFPASSVAGETITFSVAANKALGSGEALSADAIQVTAEPVLTFTKEGANISATPMEAGTYRVKIEATDGGKTAVLYRQLRVVEATSPVFAANAFDNVPRQATAGAAVTLPAVTASSTAVDATPTAPADVAVQWIGSNGARFDVVSGLTRNDDGSYRFLPAQTGSYAVQYTATNEEGYSVQSEEIILSVAESAAVDMALAVNVQVPEGASGAAELSLSLFGDIGFYNQNPLFTFDNGDTLEYEIYVPDYVAGMGSIQIYGDGKKHNGTDECWGIISEYNYDTFKNLTDENGVNWAPAADIGIDGAFVSRSIDLSALSASSVSISHVAYVLKMSDIAPIAGRAFTVYFRNIRFADENGNPKRFEVSSGWTYIMDIYKDSASAPPFSALCMGETFTTEKMTVLTNSANLQYGVGLAISPEPSVINNLEQGDTKNLVPGAALDLSAKVKLYDPVTGETDTFDRFEIVSAPEQSQASFENGIFAGGKAGEYRLKLSAERNGFAVEESVDVTVSVPSEITFGQTWPQSVMVGVFAPQKTGTVRYSDSYSENATLVDILSPDDESIIDALDAEGNINLAQAGEYIFEYQLSDRYGNTKNYFVFLQAEADNVDPVIEITGTLESSYAVNAELDLSVLTIVVTDNVDENIAPVVKVFRGDTELTVEGKKVALDRTGEYKVVITAEDSAGNSAEEVIEFSVVDNVAPVISESGLEYSAEYQVGDVVTVLDAAAEDNYDAEVAVSVTVIAPSGEEVDVQNGTFTVTEAGKYIIRYECSDAAGNAAEAVTVEITVQEQPTGCGSGMSIHGFWVLSIALGGAAAAAALMRKKSRRIV